MNSKEEEMRMREVVKMCRIQRNIIKAFICVLIFCSFAQIALAGLSNPTPYNLYREDIKRSDSDNKEQNLTESNSGKSGTKKYTCGAVLKNKPMITDNSNTTYSVIERYINKLSKIQDVFNNVSNNRVFAVVSDFSWDMMVNLNKLRVGVKTIAGALGVKIRNLTHKASMALFRKSEDLEPVTMCVNMAENIVCGADVSKPIKDK